MTVRKWTRAAALENLEDLSLEDLTKALTAAGYHNFELTEDTPEPTPKYGEPGFQFPPCGSCGSRSFRCGCD